AQQLTKATVHKGRSPFLMPKQKKPLDERFFAQKGTGFCRGVWRCVCLRSNLRNLGKRPELTRIMTCVERYENLYFCDCA
ncbi:hypothetical protein ACTQ0H_09365, partial [Collinsella sp. LCP21S3_A3]|uniref:hypothetical protein n=1 Tax=Collinsella sp. LCP21S3_A3 TaxID=3438769 RepID=UPI003F8FF25F